MLQTLRVKNFAIVEDVRVDLADGLNVITGETGAGKSILAGALGFVLGERADRTMVRAGEDKCSVEAAFQLPDPAGVDAVLEELGIEPCADGHLIVRRSVTAAGGSRGFVNDCPATVQAMKRVGVQLVDMHGPHDHQSLLDQAFQLDLLDAFGHLQKTKADYEARYREVQELRRRRDALDGDDQETARQIDTLRYQIKEIDEAEVTEGEEEELEREHAIVSNASLIVELASGIEEALTEGDASAFNAAAFAQKALSDMSDVMAEAADWRDEARSIAVQIQELSSTVRSCVQDIEADPARLQWLEDRKGLLQRLKRKYGGSVDEVLAFVVRARDRLGDLETRGERIAEIESEIAGAEARMLTAGRGLSDRRLEAAERLARAITEELRGLGFEHGAFGVAIESVAPNPAGLDRVEFGFAPNVGEPMRPLRAIASSGEISRVMLAVKAVLALHDRIPVLVFDEIDSNVGGEMGNAIGARLTAVAASHQVICITHLPQVAVYGTTHFVVAKQVREGRTHTGIERLEGDRRAEEVARMLGGKDLTSVTLRHAREMLQKR